MDAKDILRLQEAYLEVVENQQLDEEITPERRAKYKRGLAIRQTDLYDVILSHLLDEGYAETPEAAEAIMVNMSEDWRDSIIEDTEYLDEGLTKARKERALKMGLKHLATAEEGSSVTKNADKNMPSRRGGGSGLRRNPNRWGRPGTITPGPGVLKRDDRGSGNRARRRAGEKVADNVDRYYYNDESPDF